MAEPGRSDATGEADSDLVCRLIVDHLDRATRHLSLIDQDPVRSVHEARKMLKRTRAALHLLRKADRRNLSVEDTALGNAARLLGPIRDQHVARQLEASRRGDERPVAPPPLAPSVRTWVAQSMAILLGVRLRATGWDLSSLTPDDLVKAATRSYEQARKRWKRSFEDRDFDGLHQCRKAVKRSHYQVEALAGELDDERLISLEQLGELLGQHHDESLLLDDEHSASHLQELEGMILELGARVFSHRPAEHRAWIRDLLSRTR